MTAPARVISLLPSATEILFAIGAGDLVVGVTHECDFPDAAGALPAVTSSLLSIDGVAPGDIDRHIHAARHEGSSIYGLDEGALEALRPDLVVTQELCDVCAVAYSEVRRAVRRLPGDVPVLSLEPRTLEEICASVEEMGAATGQVDGAGRVATAMRQRIAECVALDPPEPRPRVVCIEWTDPIMVGGHWVPEMVRIAGGIDALGHEDEPSRYVAWDEVVAAQPDVMVLMPCGYDLPHTLGLVPEIASRPGFDDLACVRAGRVFAVDGSAYFSRPGPRIVDGLGLLAWAFRAQPGDPPPSRAAYWNQPATSRIALMVPTALNKVTSPRLVDSVVEMPEIARLAITCFAPGLRSEASGFAASLG
jgi:iron complex transport system substrate-binding protein